MTPNTRCRGFQVKHPCQAKPCRFSLSPLWAGASLSFSPSLCWANSPDQPTAPTLYRFYFPGWWSSFSGHLWQGAISLFLPVSLSFSLSHSLALSLFLCLSLFFVELYVVKAGQSEIVNKSIKKKWMKSFSEEGGWGSRFDLQPKRSVDDAEDYLGRSCPFVRCSFAIGYSWRRLCWSAAWGAGVWGKNISLKLYCDCELVTMRLKKKKKNNKETC